MTIKDLYDWAVKNGITDYNIVIRPTGNKEYLLDSIDVEYCSDIDTENSIIKI